MVERISSLLRDKRLKIVPSDPIPIDVLINHVFTRLPVRFIIRCKSVCKQWFRVLSEPEFISFYHKTQKEKPHNQKILCGPVKFDTYRYLKNKDNYPLECRTQTYYSNKLVAFDGVFYSIDLQSSSGDEVAVRLPGFPLHQTCYRVSRIMGYSNGMVCLETHDKSYKSYLLFGNPSTGVYKLLPERITRSLFCSFCYDSLSDDYKFVRVLKGMTQIYYLKSDSWRTISNSPSDIIFKDMSFGCFLDGSIYWVVKTTGWTHKIVWFNLQDELLREQTFPSAQLLTEDTRDNTLSMKVVGDSICIINTAFSRRKEFVMWLMINKGDKCEFIKLMNVTLSLPIKRHFRIEPLYFKNDAEVLCYVKDDEHQTFYCSVDSKTGRIEDLTIHGMHNKLLLEYKLESHQSGYIDSLVAPY